MAEPAARTAAALVAVAALSPGLLVWGPEGAIGTLAGARGAARGTPGTDAGGFVLVRLTRMLGVRHSTHLVPAAWINTDPVAAEPGGGRANGVQVGSHPGRITLDATRRQVAGCPRLRPDAHIRADVRRALDEAHLTRGGASTHASVSEGVVEVEGRTPGEDGMRRVVDCALAVPGVVAVVNRTTGFERPA